MSKHRPMPLMAEELETRLMFAIELDIVALHEFGHSLGLAHYADTAANSIMEAYYNANYNKANLASDVAVTLNGSDGYANLMELFSDTAIANNTTSWKDSLDGNLNGTVNVKYSFVPDGTRLDSNKRSNLFATLNSKIGPTATWQALFTEELQRWANVSSGNLSFSLVSDNGAAMGSSGAVQNDSRFGDIRIGGHRFDGKGGVLAHAYYPPPNGGTTAGDAHFASEEDWINGDPLTAEGAPVGQFARLVQTAEGYFFHCTFGEEPDHDHAASLTENSDDQHGDSQSLFLGGWLATTVEASESGANSGLEPGDAAIADLRLSTPSGRVASEGTATIGRAGLLIAGEPSTWSAYALPPDAPIAIQPTTQDGVTARVGQKVSSALRRAE